MDDLVRLSKAGGTPVERRLLDAARADLPPDRRACDAVLAAVALTPSVAAGGAKEPSALAKLASSTMAKWALLSAVGVVVGATSLVYVTASPSAATTNARDPSALTSAAPPLVNGDTPSSSPAHLVAPVPSTVPLVSSAVAASSAPSTAANEAVPPTGSTSRERAALLPKGAPLRNPPSNELPTVAADVITTQVAPPSPSIAPPEAAPPASAPSMLRDQALALEGAREALASGRLDEASRDVEDFERRFPGGMLAEEAFVLRVQIAVAKHDTDGARTIANAFIRAYPTSSYLPVVKKVVGL